jgi:hypothetical protein
MLVVALQRNTDGVQFYAAGRAMAGRDYHGRFMGNLPELDEDEVLEFGEERLSNEDSIFAQFAAETLVSTDADDSEDDIDHNNSTVDDSEDDCDDLSPAEWVRMRYRTDYPELWDEDAGRELVIPSQSSARHDNYLKVLGWSADKCNRTWKESHGNRGRHKKQFWWSTLADHRRDLKREDWDQNLS